MRDRQRIGVVAGAVVVCGALAVAGVVLAEPGSHPRVVEHLAAGEPASVVPWVDRPAQPPPPSPSPPPPAVRYRPCTGADVSVRQGDGGSGLGNVVTRLVLTNRSSSPCSFDGYPTSFVGVRRDGSQVTLHTSHGTFADGNGIWPANLQPGDHAGLNIGTGDACAALNSLTPHPDPFTAEIIGLPGGGAANASARFDPSCGLDVSAIGGPAQPRPDPDDYAGLTATGDVPATVAAGTILHFTVTLTNPTTAAIALDPCPVYEESVYAGEPHSYVYELNCDTIDTIAPGQSVTYAMQLPIPDVPGTAKFGWSTPGGVLGYGGVFTIR